MKYKITSKFVTFRLYTNINTHNFSIELALQNFAESSLVNHRFASEKIQLYNQ